MSLNLKWKELKNEATTENLILSISEIVRLYKRGRLKVTPSYQRVYRWGNEQKSRLIESLLLKYPIPPIITIQTEDDNGLYQYEIIDGAQRISTILEFMENEIPKNMRVINSNEVFEKIVGAQIFTELNGKDWEDFKAENFDFIFEASTILFTNLLTVDDDIKYDVFARVNTLSTKLSPQEVRNSILVFKDRFLYERINQKIFTKSSNFIGKANLSKRQDMEFFIEFVFIKHLDKYYNIIDEKIREHMRISKKDASKHLDLLLTAFTEEVTPDELDEGFDDYLEFLELTSEWGFKKYDNVTGTVSGSPIKFFFEILCHLFFRNRELITNDFYAENFSKNYHDILREDLIVNNPNARNRFELSKKMVDELNGTTLFTQ